MRGYISDVRGAALFGARLAPIRPTTRARRRAEWAALVIALAVTDALMMGLALALAYFVRFEADLELFQAQVLRSRLYYQALAGLIVPLWLGIFAAVGLYNRQHLLGGTEEYQRVLRASTYGLLVVMVGGFLEPAFVLARGWLVLGWLFTVVLVAAGRFALRRLGYQLRRSGVLVSPAVIIGANPEGISLAQQLAAWATSGLHVVGFVDQKLPPGAPVWEHLTVLGPVEQLEHIAQEHDVEEAILASSAYSVRDNLLRIFQRFGSSSTLNLRLSSGLYEILTTGLTVREFAYVPLVGVNRLRLTGWDQALKLALDYAIAVPGLILLTPLLMLIALAVRLDSPGPVLYRRRVMGVGGRQFDAYKFRTMRVDGDQILAQRPELRRELAQNGKLRDDPRVTPLGRFLRRTSLDELPQLVNVLRREMSLVGPRMISPAEMEKYAQWGMNLLTVKPGITGLWQVSGRSDITYEERVQLDMYYIRNWSLWLDLQLLSQTLPVVLRGTGAY
jgi:exopolysaccharide biosynthesis polyprenyl glycosylphosphotransferase